MNLKISVTSKASGPVIVMLIALTFSITTAHSYVSNGLVSNNATNMQIYGCEIYKNTPHCDPLISKFKSYQVSNTSSSLISPVTRVPTFVDGKQGKALQLQANYLESVQLPNSPVLDHANFSISFWVKELPSYTIFAQSELYGNIISHTNDSQTSGWVFDMVKGDVNGSISTVGFTVFNDAGKRFEPTPISLPSNNTFVNIVATFDGSAVKIYKDGALFGKTEFSGHYIPNPKFPIRIGAGSYCTTCNMGSAIIDDLRIYNKALDGNQIKSIFSGDQPKSASVLKDLVGQWTFDGNLNDSSGNGNHGTYNTLVASMVFAPDGRLFFSEKDSGNIRIMKDDKVLQTPFATLYDIYVNWEQGLLGLAIDPDFRVNHFVYLYYTYLDNKTGEPFNKIVRFTDINNIGTHMVVLLDKIPASRGFHSGGALAFGKDGKLYVTVGDGTQHTLAQDPKVLLGKVLRLNKDGTIPSDNPYPNSPVYTIGHRNMYGIAFDKNGTELITENGDFHYDEINVIVKGGNYGFPTLQPPNEPPENSSHSIKPIRSYWFVIAPTQMIYYDGDKIPQLKGKFLFGTDYSGMFALTLDNSTHKVVEEEQINLNQNPPAPVIAIAQSPSGDIYYGGFSIYKLKSVDFSSKKQILFPIEINSSQPVEIKNLQIYTDKKNMTVDIHGSNSNSNKFQHDHITIQIPKSLLEKISAIYNYSANRREQYLNITNSSADYNTISIPISSSVDTRISIIG